MSPRDREAEAFHGHLEAHDLESARALALGLLDEGVSVADVLREVVARAQVDVGERWHRSEYSVADEHAATAISDAVVSLLASERAPVTEEPHVVVVCVEGEWHLLPARLLVESLRADGFRVTFLVDAPGAPDGLPRQGVGRRGRPELLDATHARWRAVLHRCRP